MMSNRINRWETDPDSLLKIAKKYVKTLNEAPNEVFFYPYTLDTKYQVFDQEESRAMVALAITEMMSDCIGYSAPENIINAIKYSIDSETVLYIPFSEVDRLNVFSGYRHTIYKDKNVYLEGWGLLVGKPIGEEVGYKWAKLKQIAL